MIWRLRTRELDLTRRGAVMGIVNVTPDSFSDGGAFASDKEAIAHGLAMLRQGAEIIDVGGESTRPGAAAVPRDEEMSRVLPVIRGLIREAPGCILSVDTSKAAVAAAAIEAGAEIVNDVTGLRGDPAMARVVASTGAGVVIMHMRGNPRTMQSNPVYTDVVGVIRTFFEERRNAALAAGIQWERMVFDPGIGFGKTPEHNLQILRALESLAVPPAPAGSSAPPGEPRPVLLGVSRKSFIARLLGEDAIEARDWPTVALTAYAREKGVRVVRVHDARPNFEALRMTEAIMGHWTGAKPANVR